MAHGDAVGKLTILRHGLESDKAVTVSLVVLHIAEQNGWQELHLLLMALDSLAVVCNCFLELGKIFRLWHRKIIICRCHRWKHLLGFRSEPWGTTLISLLESRREAALRFYSLVQLMQVRISVAFSHSIVHKLADRDFLVFAAELGITTGLAVVVELLLIFLDQVDLNAIELVKVTGIFEATD